MIMAAITIGRLALHLQGLSAPDGERLAQRIGERLAAADMAWDVPRDVEVLRIHGTLNPDSGLEGLVDQIMGDLLRQLARTL
jgi:hypothetical protein